MQVESHGTMQALFLLPQSIMIFIAQGQNIFDQRDWKFQTEEIIEGYLSGSVICAELFPQNLWPQLTTDGKGPNMITTHAGDGPLPSTMRWTCTDITEPNRRTSYQQRLNKSFRGLGPFLIRCPMGWQRQYPVLKIAGYNVLSGNLEVMRTQRALCCNSRTSTSVPVSRTARKCVKLAYASFAAFLPQTAKNSYNIISWVSRSAAEGARSKQYKWTQFLKMFPILENGNVVEHDEILEHVGGKLVDHTVAVYGVDYKACVGPSSVKQESGELRLNIAAELFFATSEAFDTVHTEL